METLQGKCIQHNGKCVDKRTVFCKLYDEADPHDIQLNLLLSNMHDEYHVIEKESYKAELLKAELIEEVQVAVLTDIAIRQLRKSGTLYTYEAIIGGMVEAMTYVLNEHRQIEKEIKERV